MVGEAQKSERKPHGGRSTKKVKENLIVGEAPKSVKKISW
jgi:hypothetical protein